MKSNLPNCHRVHIYLGNSDSLALHKIEVLSKPGCHLCERVIENLRTLEKQNPFELKIVDITEDEILYKNYMLKIPVIRLDEKDVLEVEAIAHPSDSWTKLENLVLSLQD